MNRVDFDLYFFLPRRVNLFTPGFFVRGEPLPRDPLFLANNVGDLRVNLSIAEGVFELDTFGGICRASAFFEGDRDSSLCELVAALDPSWAPCFLIGFFVLPFLIGFGLGEGANVGNGIFWKYKSSSDSGSFG